ncbi:MAG: porin family protein [Thermodesulfobacteriota bacterium]
MKKAISALVLASVLLLPGLAAAETVKPFYIGAGGLYAIEDFDVKDEAALRAYGFGNITFDNTWGFDIFAGYRFSENFALEFDFGYLPDFEWKQTAQVLPGLSITAAEKATITTYALEAKLMLPAGSGFYPYFMAGLGYMNGDVEASARNNNTGATFSNKDSESDPFARIGLGCEKFFGDRFSMRLSADYNMGFNDVDEARYFTVGLGAAVHF